MDEVLGWRDEEYGGEMNPLRCLCLGARNRDLQTVVFEEN